LALDSLHQYPTLTCDIEAFSLEFYKAGIGSIAFAWNQHEGIAFSVDYNELPTPTDLGFFGYQLTNQKIRTLLTAFFLSYKGTLIYHNITYDAKVLTYELFMKNMLDTAGMIEGIKAMTKDVHCTKIITYLATNSCAGNVLGLKENSQEFTGNYSQQEIKDIRRIPKDQLLRYNLLDCLATWFVFNKNLPRMINDKQDKIYNTLMLPGIKVVMQEELCGMPIDMAQVLQAEHLAVLSQSKEIQDYTLQLQKEEMVKKNLLLKVKVKPLEDFADIAFNPNSNQNLQGLLHDQWKLPVIDTTDSGSPATGGKTLKKHLVHLMSEYSISEEELNT
jgi:DNA polymerase-1